MMTGLAGLAMWLMMGIMLIGLASGGIAWTWRHRHPRPHSQPPPADQTPEETLRRRYATGEIDHDEYLHRQRDLGQR
jgi:putative membrane protein